MTDHTPKLTTFAAYGPSAGSARVRVHDWLRHLGIEADVHSYLGGSSLGRSDLLSSRTLAAEIELLRASHRPLENVLLSRRATPFWAGFRESRILERAAHGVYDFDDAIMLASPGMRETLLQDARRWRRAVEAADVVIAGNEHLAEAAARHHRDVRVIPSCVEPGDYLPKTERMAEAPRAVWIGSPHTEHYLRDIEKPLLEVHRETGLRLTVISAGSADLGLLDSIVDRENWTASTFASQLSAADIGIMPLRDTPWELGKCAYKLLQYGAASLPSVASPVGANAIALNRGIGLPATSHAEWADALIHLCEADVARRAGSTARKAIEEHYSFQSWQGAWTAAVLTSRA